MPITVGKLKTQPPAFLQNGFTLVELLAVITIILITTAAIIPTFTGYLRNQNVKQASEQLKSDLRTIQNKALTGSLSDSTISGSPVTHWGIRVGANASTYDYFISANTTCPASVPTAQYQGGGSFSSDLQIKVAANSCIFFSVSDGSVTSNFASSQIIVGFVGSTASGDCRRIQFNANGLIYTGSSVACT